MTKTATAATTATTPTGIHQARWAWWGVPAGVLGLFGNLVSSHASLTDAGPSEAMASLDRTTQHIGTLAGMGAFFCLALVAAGWRRWAGSASGLAEASLATFVAVSATLVLFGTGLRGALAEYLPGGINDDNFTEEGLYALFMLHDTAPWFAWWGVLATAALLAYLSFAGRVVPRWLGAVSGLAVLAPLVVMVGSGAVAGGGFVGPLWLTIASVTIAVRGLPEPRARISS